MKKKSFFTIDKVSEDSFYGNLLLGLPKFLDKCLQASNQCLFRLPPASPITILSWEHNNGVLLTEELRNFYASTDGFCYSYLFSYEGVKKTDTDVAFEHFLTGRIEVNPLEKLSRVYGYETRNAEKIERINNTYQLILSPRSKVFELCKVELNGKVVLVYINDETPPSIWLLSNTIYFSYLARNLATYLRMAIAYLGMPGWQFVSISSERIPEYSKEMLNIVAPGVLPQDINLVDAKKDCYDSDTNNVIDPSVFSSSYVSVYEQASSVTTSTNTKGCRTQKKSKFTKKR